MSQTSSITVRISSLLNLLNSLVPGEKLSVDGNPIPRRFLCGLGRKGLTYSNKYKDISGTQKIENKLNSASVINKVAKILCQHYFGIIFTWNCSRNYKL